MSRGHGASSPPVEVAEAVRMFRKSGSALTGLALVVVVAVAAAWRPRSLPTTRTRSTPRAASRGR